MHIYAYRYIYKVFHSSLLDDIVYRMNYRLSTLNFTSFNLVLFGFQAKLEWMGTLFTRSTMNNCNRNIGHTPSITRWKEGGDRFLNSVHSPNSISTHFRFTGSEQIAQHDGWILTGYDHCRPRHGPLPLYYDSYLSSSTSSSFFPRRFNSHNRFLLRGKVKRRREPTMRHREVRCQLNRGYRDISHFLFIPRIKIAITK